MHDALVFVARRGPGVHGTEPLRHPGLNVEAEELVAEHMARRAPKQIQGVIRPHNQRLAVPEIAEKKACLVTVERPPAM
jgi:hypothetical protein